jgi:hypothetical protein
VPYLDAPRVRGRWFTGTETTWPPARRNNVPARRQVAVHVVELRQGEEILAVEQFQTAAGVGGVVAEQAGAGGVGDARGQALDPAVLAVGAVAGDQQRTGTALGLGAHQQGGDVRRVILAVAIQGCDPEAARGAHAGDDGGTLAAAGGVATPDDACFAEALGGVVQARVIDVDDLMRDMSESGADFGDQRGDVGALVSHRDNNRNQRIRELHGQAR